MNSTLKSALQQTRELFGDNTPRSLTGVNTSDLFPAPPDWVGDDALNEVVRQREMLLQQGRVVLSARVMANRTLYSLGSAPSAMVAVWSEDPFYEENPEEIAFLAREVGSIKNTTPDDERAETARLLTDEMSRPLIFPLPATFTDGRLAFLSALLVWREHLPFGYLTGLFLPLVVLPEKTNAALILPRQFWSDTLKDR